MCSQAITERTIQTIRYAAPIMNSTNWEYMVNMLGKQNGVSVSAKLNLVMALVFVL